MAPDARNDRREHPQLRAQGGDGSIAGWRDLVRGLAADIVVVAEAEAYAAGERRLAIHHRADQANEIEGLDARVRAVATAIPGATKSPSISLGDAGTYTRWHFRAPMAAEQLAAARELIEQLCPGSWEITADEH